MAKLRSTDDIAPYEALNCTHTSLRRAGRQLTQIYDDALAPSGLTTSQSLLVSQIDQLGGAPGSVEGPTLVQLAKRLSVQVSALTHGLKPLQRDGLVELVVDSSDRRSKRARLTELGLQRTQQMYALWIAVNERIDMVLGEGAAGKLRELANQVAAPEFAEQFSAAAEKTP